ncbi:YwmB family TATA-box binding protein [Fictibacillus sp. Mic-4]|uniref:YwmB family TATA-box binding protein n=1 Tax=Fictibacillus sp. Mic-4 TaxID=3132826 RepID=UPI003CEE3CAA
MKKCVLFFILIFVLASSFGVNAKSKVGSSQLTDIVNAMEANQIKVAKWSLYTKGTLGLISDFKGYEKMVGQLMRTTPGFNWESLDSKRPHWEVTGTRRNNVEGVTERLTLVQYPHKGKLETYLIYAAKGKGWQNKKWNEFKGVFDKQMDTIFSKPMPVFTCVTGMFNDKMNVGLQSQARKLLHTFSAVPIEELNEKTFVSISAYTRNWNEVIMTKKRKMNVQIALRDKGLGKKRTVTIGTPIITSEY